MMARQHAALFPVLKELNIGFVAFTPMANGFLTGAYGKGERFDAKTDYRASMPQFTDEAVEKNRSLLKLLADLADVHSATPAQISLAWMIDCAEHIVPIPGSRKPERMRENLGAADIELSAAEIAEIDAALDGMEMSEVFGGTPLKK